MDWPVQGNLACGQDGPDEQFLRTSSAHVKSEWHPLLDRQCLKTVRREVSDGTQDTSGHEPVRRTLGARSHLFSVRLWKERDGGVEYRGSVCDVVSGGFRSFRDWSDLVRFMTERMEEDEQNGFTQGDANDVGGRRISQ